MLGWEAQLQDRRFLDETKFKGVAGPFVAYLFGLRIYPEAQTQARQFGVGVFDPDGELEIPRLRSA